ncbi:hypothetical protein DAPPUDRAFT_264921 [Daphnia pulex]|uniref:Uncharacterized protein n=1 Tax=Daphnia pulex TaxID=6669 RepID=E9HSJ8_DAPPU|nr:hypothetical protein DAPPUDRAFT_264921 [Daphnia pulex]|eukprot:EFX65274.1 hypothetical protein DAPPUDRAFT_264921 [Daphnia pulex]
MLNTIMDKMRGMEADLHEDLPILQMRSVPHNALKSDVVQPKFNLRTRKPLKNSVSNVEKGFGKGERVKSSETKDELISILENGGFDGDFSNLAETLPNQVLDRLRHLMNQY